MLRDIKPNEVIPDYSLYIFIGLIFISLIILFFVIKFLYNKLKRKIIMLSDGVVIKGRIEDSKKFAYEITPHLRELEEFELINELEKYKYKKDVQNIDESLVEKIREVFKKEGIKIEFWVSISFWVDYFLYSLWEVL